MTSHAQRNLLHAYLDNELDLVRSMELEDHLAECGECAHEVASYRTLRENIAGADLRYATPPDLRSRIDAALRKEERQRAKSARPQRSIPWWNWATVAAACVIVAAALIVPRFVSPRENSTLARELVADHVRSLMASHLTDVLTSDQHTVKPWFTGKIDFSPQVPDLSAEGFDLIGGRLDYLDGHPAAAIVYQRHKHVINLFTWPSAGADEAPHATEQDGFHVIQWRKGGMDYCAISDVNEQELSQFVSLLRR
ncbi:MAG TPA: anti-sigma factor [Terriglobales bacterium]|nr:anti-sigma factor [Terriglobales bacterium]